MKPQKPLYIVIDNNGRPMSLAHYDDTPPGGVLLFSDAVSLLTSSAAHRAIKRTQLYADLKGFRWEVSGCRIVRTTTDRPKRRRRK